MTLIYKKWTKEQKSSPLYSMWPEIDFWHKLLERINKLYIKSKCIEVYEGLRTSV